MLYFQYTLNVFSTIKLPTQTTCIVIFYYLDPLHSKVAIIDIGNID